MLKKRLNIEMLSPFAKKIIEGTFLLTIGTILSRVLLAIAYIILARILTTNEYGQYGMLKSTIDNFLIFASMGIGLTTTKYISEFKNTDKEVASSILGTALITVLVLGVIIAGVIFFLSDYISLNLLNAPSLGNLLNIVAVIIVLTAFNGIQNGALLGLQSFKKISIVNIFQGLILFFGLCIGGYFYGVQGAITGNLIATIFVTLLIQYMLRKECHKNGLTISLKKWKNRLKTIYKFALPASLSTIITAPTVWILNTMLVNTPNGYSELGIYSAVVVLTIIIQMLNGSISNVLLPIFLANDTALSPKKEFFNYFGAWFVALTIAIPLIVFPEFVGFILGSKYPPDKVKWILSLALFSSLIIAHRQGVARDLIMKNKMWLSVFSMGQWALTSYFCFLFLKQYGAIGFAMSFCIGYITNLIIVVPFFIYQKICPRFIFYNSNVISIWFSVISLVIVNNYFIEYWLRAVLSIIVIAILILNLKQLYKKNVQYYS
jgi:O-antigen/teichoic acid export membrane protein